MKSIKKIIHNIKVYFSDIIKTNSFLKSELVRLKKENNFLNEELFFLKEKVLIKDLEFNLKDIDPKDVGERKFFVVKVAAFHRDILKPKMKQMITNCQILLSETENSREMDLTLKGAIYAFKEIIHWGDSICAEDVSNTVENVSGKKDY